MGTTSSGSLEHSEPALTYPDSVDYLYALGNEFKVVKLGLETMAAVLAALGDPHRSFRSIHVAGTNGKGSTSAMIESALRASGIRSGLYTSPHLVQPTERIQIDGRDVSTEDFTAAFNEVHACAEQLMRQGVLEYHPSYFETVTAMAFLLFRRHQVHTAVVEVGLGGRLDSTNVIQPVLSVVTPIDFDHERFLGSSIESIAWEKAGILKPGTAAVFARQRPEAETVLSKRAEALNCPVTRTSSYQLTELHLTARGSTFLANGRPVTSPLAGEHQVENTLTALAALDTLHIPWDGIANTRWPGRLECVATSPDIILDGAHNPAGARALAAYIKRFYQNRPIWIVYGAMRDKSVQEITEVLFPLAHHVILTAPATHRAVHPESLLHDVHHPSTVVAPTVPEAIQLARSAPPEAAVFITGSLYVVGEARALLVK